MLKNIIKYEWKSISLKLIIVHIAMILFCGLSIVAIQKWNTSMLVFIFTFFYFICTVAAGLMTALIPAVRYYRSMYTDEAYLTRTTPVKTSTIILGKELVFLFWSLINLCTNVLLFTWISNVSKDFSSLGLAGVLKESALLLKMPVALLVLYAAIWVLILTIFSNLTVYLSISIGSLFANHKGIASIVSYVILHFVMQIVVLLVFMGAPSRSVEYAASSSGFDITVMSASTEMSKHAVALHALHLSIISFVIISGFCALFGFISWYIADKKLNLN